MQIIPVIDVQGGLVVHAKQGNRTEYQAINTPLCQSSKPVDVLNCFKELGDFETVYVADLDAIMNQGNNDKLLLSLLESFPETAFWIDQGLTPSTIHKHSIANYIPVIGSECLQLIHLESLMNLKLPYVLSLDHSSAGKLGPSALFTEARFWPENIIIMSIGRVGSYAGPDFEKLQFFCRHYPHKNFIAAGGVRNCNDLLRLEKTGVDRALVASALHFLQIRAEDIDRLHQATRNKLPNHLAQYR